jgi:hypothetical protein
LLSTTWPQPTGFFAIAVFCPQINMSFSSLVSQEA